MEQKPFDCCSISSEVTVLLKCLEGDNNFFLPLAKDSFPFFIGGWKNHHLHFSWLSNLFLTPQQSKSTMPKRNGEEPAQRLKSLIPLCLQCTLKRKNLAAMTLNIYVIKDNRKKPSNRSINNLEY